MRGHNSISCNIYYINNGLEKLSASPVVFNDRRTMMEGRGQEATIPCSENLSFTSDYQGMA